MELTIERAAGPTAEIEELLEGLDRALDRFYAPDQRHRLALDALFAPGVDFYLARTGASALGCAGVALIDDYAEVKRMFVRPQARGQGIAKALLGRIEARAREAGVDLLRLETGAFQDEAIGLYERAGFRRRPPFGAYARMAAHAIETSVFFERRLSGTASAL